MSDVGKLKDATSDYVSRYPLTFAKDVDPSLSRRYKIAWNTARDAANILKQKYKADKVVVFGSLLYKSRFNKWSDIDLAVWGVPDNRFYAAVGEIIGLDSKFKIDVVDYNDCKSSLQKVIKNEGIEV